MKAVLIVMVLVIAIPVLYVAIFTYKAGLKKTDDVE